MNKQEACDLLQSLRDQIDVLCEQIDQDDDPDQARQRYSQIKTDLEQIVFPLRVSSNFDKATHVVQAFVFPALNQALLEFATPKGGKITDVRTQQLYNVSTELNYYHEQLKDKPE